MDTKLIKLKLWQNRFGIGLWLGLLLLVVFVYHLFSDGDFSFLLTLGGLVRMMALGLICAKIKFDPNQAAGVSAKTMQLYCMTFFFRLCSILFYEGYLPFDKTPGPVWWVAVLTPCMHKLRARRPYFHPGMGAHARSGDWFYQFVEIVSLLLAILALVLIYTDTQYIAEQDSFGNLKIPNSLGVVYIVVPGLILALLFHPSLNSNFFTDTAWTLAMCIEAVAVLPQLVVFQRTGGEVEFYTSHFVAALGLARLFSLLFWLSSYHELNDKYSSSVTGQYVGHFVVGSQIVQLLLMVDYFYYYIKAMRKGVAVRIPTAADNV